MTTKTVKRPSNPSSSQMQLLAGVGFILTGLFVMVGHTTGAVRLLGLVFLLGLGLIFLLWGVIARDSGPMIPGALLTGVTTGTLLTQEVYGLRSLETAGVHALSIAGGVLLITLLTGLFAGQALWWPLIPAVILFLGGLNLLLKDIVLLNVGDFWPLALIVAGAYLILRFRRSS